MTHLTADLGYTNNRFVFYNILVQYKVFFITTKYFSTVLFIAVMPLVYIAI